MILNNFYKLPPPPKDAIEKRYNAVAEIIKQMGDKYRLSQSMPRKQ